VWNPQNWDVMRGGVKTAAAAAGGEHVTVAVDAEGAVTFSDSHGVYRIVHCLPSTGVLADNVYLEYGYTVQNKDSCPPVEFVVKFLQH